MRHLVHTFVVVSVLWLSAMSAVAQSPVRKTQLVAADTLASLSWTSLGVDPKGDGVQARLPDAKELFYAIDSKADLVWFKVNVWEVPPERWFGISIAVDSDDKAENGMVWWGTNKGKFDRLATAFLFKAQDYWQGYMGVADSESVGRGNMINLSSAVKAGLDREQRAIVIGVPRAALGTAPAVRVIATVGSMTANNDDVPNEGMATVRIAR